MIIINALGYLITNTRLYPRDDHYFMSFEQFAFPEDTHVITFTPGDTQVQKMKNRQSKEEKVND